MTNQSYLDKAIVRCREEASLAYSFNPNSCTNSLLQSVLNLEFARWQDGAEDRDEWAVTIGKIHHP